MTRFARRWPGRPIHVVSFGLGDPEGLDAAARSAISQADTLIADARFQPALANLAPQADQLGYPSPLSDLLDLLHARADQRLVIVASGDALLHGIGAWLNRHIGKAYLRYHPNISSLQAAMHAAGLPWQEARVVSLHGRPLSTLRRHLAPGQLLGLFTDEQASPAAIARELVDHGFGQAQLWVCERLGTAAQTTQCLTAHDLAAAPQLFDTLNVCIADLSITDHTPVPGTAISFPGIADELFSTGAEPGFGMISKREVRLAILSTMQPCRGEIAWDIGAGCGSVSIEWARWNPGGTIYAVESTAERLLHIDINRDRFGVMLNCLPVAGTAPDCCEQLPAPGCIFIGGSNGNLQALIDFAWSQLSAGGKLVVSAVSADSQRIVERWRQACHAQGIRVDWSEITVEKQLPGSAARRRLSPVQVLGCRK